MSRSAPGRMVSNCPHSRVMRRICTCFGATFISFAPVGDENLLGLRRNVPRVRYLLSVLVAHLPGGAEQVEHLHHLRLVVPGDLGERLGGQPVDLPPPVLRISKTAGRVNQPLVFVTFGEPEDRVVSVLATPTAAKLCSLALMQ